MNLILGIILLVGLIVAVGVWLRNMRPATRANWSNAFLNVWSWMRKNAQELVGIPAALVIYWISGVGIRWFEPSSALYDSGVLQGITVAIVHLVIGNSIARFGVRMNISWFSPPAGFTTEKREQHTRWLFTAYLAAYCLLASLI